MPDSAGAMARLWEEGILKADSFLRQECGARRLTDEEASAMGGRLFIRGWQMTVETPRATRRLNVFADAQFPLSVPRFVLVDRPPFPTWPHIEEDGLMCLAESAVAKFREPQHVLGELLHQAYRLIRDCESGLLEDDFRREFYTYWNRQVPTTAPVVWSLLKPEGPNRIVHLWSGESRPVVGESEQEVLTWLCNRGGNRPQFDYTEEAGLLWIDKALLPGEYPNTGGDVYRLANRVPGGKALLERLAQRESGPYYFLIGAESGNGPCFGAVRVSRPLATGVYRRKCDHSTDGFRPGKVPVALQAIRVFSNSAPVARLKVERVDAEWIHGRGHDARQKELRGKTVIVFGCGSIGAPLAHQLAMAGVGRMFLVDPQGLTWANVGRHILGACHVDANKATDLAEVLRIAYPHSEFRGFQLSSHDFLRQHPDLIGRADLIICAVADWKAELELNLRQRSGEVLAPVLDVWTEEHACAGQAVVVFSAGPCLQCGFDIYGRSKLPATKWSPGSTERTEAGCGANFQPYGPVELLGTVGLAAGFALDVLLKKVVRAARRVWVGPERLLLEAGGSWAAGWIIGDANRSKGAFQEEFVWERDPECVICGEGAESDSHSLTKSENLPNGSSSPRPS